MKPGPIVSLTGRACGSRMGQSPSPVNMNQTVVPRAETTVSFMETAEEQCSSTKKIPEFKNNYIKRKLSLWRLQIKPWFNPNHHQLCKSNKVSLMHKLSISHNSLNMHPNLIIFISAWSGREDLHNYGKSLENSEIRNFTFLKNSVKKQ